MLIKIPTTTSPHLGAILLYMFIQVKLLNGFREPLWYSTTGLELPNSSLIGTIVQVPLQKRITPGVIVHQQSEKPQVSFNIRSAQKWEDFPVDTHFWHFIERLAAYHAIEPAHLLQRLKSFLLHDSIQTQLAHIQTNRIDNRHTASALLTDEQEHAYNTIRADLIAQKYQTTVLHGVTGSGKTEVYKKLIIDAHALNKTTLFMVPEVSLAVSFSARLKKELPEYISLYSFHSATPTKEKKDLWQKLLIGEPLVIIGVHLPLLLPISNLGLIIVDEEHEVGYQEKKHPHINSKDAAVLRAFTTQVPIILGSATPSLRSLYNVTHKNWRLITLSRRYAGNFPAIRLVNLRTEQKRSSFWISKELESAIRDRIQKKEQTILFLNRRGFSFFVQCTSCGNSLHCSHCSVSLTLHNDNTLHCHYCSYTKPLPYECPSCKAPESQFLKKGIGTQKVCTLLQQLFPTARVARADLDSTKNKKNWQTTVDGLHTGTIDILVGTQTITKGYDFPKVTLVGIIWADLNLHFPQYNATETTLQQLIQVAGRAGRHTQESLVIVQMMSSHNVFNYIDELKYTEFCAQEMQSRIEYGYPPHKQLCLLALQHTQEEQVDKDAYALTYALQTHRTRAQLSVQILGPAKPPVHKIQRVHLREIYLKAYTMADILTLYNNIQKQHYRSTIDFTPGVV